MHCQVPGIDYSLSKLAIHSALESATAIAISHTGVLYIAETDEKRINRIRQVSTSGEISLLAGAASECDCKNDVNCNCFSGDEATLRMPTSIVLLRWLCHQMVPCTSLTWTISVYVQSAATALTPQQADNMKWAHLWNRSYMCLVLTAFIGKRLASLQAWPCITLPTGWTESWQQLPMPLTIHFGWGGRRLALSGLCCCQRTRW